MAKNTSNPKQGTNNGSSGTKQPQTPSKPWGPLQKGEKSIPLTEGSKPKPTTINTGPRNTASENKTK